MTDLAAWLLACIDERVEEADEIHVRGCPVTFPYSMSCECGEPARVLAECAAKRRIVELHALEVEKEDVRFDTYAGEKIGPTFEVTCAICGWASDNPASGCETLLLLAQPYADRPDFDPSWLLEHTG